MSYTVEDIEKMFMQNERATAIIVPKTMFPNWKDTDEFYAEREKLGALNLVIYRK